MAKQTAEMIIQRLAAMKGGRSNWESLWQECADYTLPRKDSILSTRTPGEKKGVDLYDTTSIQSAELLAGALHGMLTNPASVWFEYTTGNTELDESDEVRHWLADATLRTHSVLNASNFQTEVHELYMDLSVFGTACMFIEEDDETAVRFMTRHLAEVYAEENNLGVIDTIYRCYKWKVRQIAQEFGIESLPEKLAKDVKRGVKLDDEMEIVHAVEPRQEWGKNIGPKNWPIASVSVLEAEKHVLRESGYREFPAAMPRWTKASGEGYGRSPAMTALADVKMINAMMKTVIKGAQKTVDPPLMVPDDGFILPIKTTPGGLNYRRSGNAEDRIEPFGNDARIDFGYQVMEDVRRRIRSSFYVDQLQLANGPQMTATEVLQRTEEKLKLMGPMLGRQHSEFLKPMINRVFAIMFRKKMFGPVPEILAGQNVLVRYASSIAKAQRASEGNNLNRFIQTVAPIADVAPDVMDNLNTDAYFREVHQIHGAPAAILRDQSEVDEIRKGRAAQAQQQQQQQQRAQLAEGLGQVLPGMADAKEAGLI